MSLFQNKMIEDEMARYLGQKDGKSLRETYTKQIQEQETLGKYLRERQKVVKESHEPNLKQLEMWSDLEALLRAKMAARRDAAVADSEGVMPAVDEEDRLVL